MTGKDSLLKFPVYNIPENGECFRISEIASIIQEHPFPNFSVSNLCILADNGRVFYSQGCAVDIFKKFNNEEFLLYSENLKETSNYWWRVILKLTTENDGYVGNALKIQKENFPPTKRIFITGTGLNRTTQELINEESQRTRSNSRYSSIRYMLAASAIFALPFLAFWWYKKHK